MSNIVDRTGPVMFALLADVFNTYADTLDYPITDLVLRPTNKPYTMTMQWKCAPMWETGNCYEIRKKFQLFAIDIFKSFGYFVEVDHPGALNVAG